jgi:2-oxoglutarate dehydrogenase E2 component (dihydrolipoamide succinyltransferase)
MINFELLLPAMGEGIIEATITKWLVANGQHVMVDQPLVEIATDKVDSELPSPVEGIITRLVYREGEIPRVGEVIALIETNGIIEETSQSTFPADRKSVESSNNFTTKNLSERFYQPAERKPVSPLVRMLAKQRGLSAVDLGQIKGTGKNEQIIIEDINHYIMEGRKVSATKDGHKKKTQTPNDAQLVRNEISINADDEVVEMDRMRKLIASHMIASKNIAAHVTSFLEADITPLVQWREAYKDEFHKKESARLTFTPVFIEAVAISLKEFPRINVSVSGESIIFRKNINVGVATALANGNLIVPVIKLANHENLGGLSRKLADLSTRARNGSLLPEEVKGGTFTITNIGQYNNLTGTPIINQPESAILAFGTIIKKPWAVKTSTGYGIAVRDIIMLSLTYDHRVIDGALGGSFLNSVAKRLENFDTARSV